MLGENRQAETLNGASDPWQTLPASWRDDAQSQLEPGESLLAWFEPDLDDKLFYARGLVLLTDRRLLATNSGNSNGTRFRAWPMPAGNTLRTNEHGGAGTLELSGADGRLACWRFTAGRSQAAARFTQRRNSDRR